VGPFLPDSRNLGRHISSRFPEPEMKYVPDRSWSLCQRSRAPVIKQTLGLDDDVKRLRSIDDSIRNDLLVEGGQLATMRYRQGQQIAIGYLGGFQQAGAVNTRPIQKREVVGPEFVTGQRQEFRQEFGHRGWCPRRTGISGMSDDPEHSILSEGTGCPRLHAGFAKPGMRKVVLHVRRVDQRNQHIDIQQIARQRSSSRS
jgi:hypothetical protein